MKKIITKVTILILILLCCLLPSLIQAQPPDPGGDPDTGVPLDGGLSILLAAGAGYAAKRIYRSKNR